MSHFPYIFSYGTVRSAKISWKVSGNNALADSTKRESKMLREQNGTNQK